MAKRAPTFTVTAAGDKVKLDDSGEAKASFTVTNTTPQAVQGQLLARPREPANAEWLTLAGESVRDFGPNGAERVVVELDVPPGSAPGSYSFRLDAVSEEDPDEDYTEGPSVAFHVPEVTEEKKRFPWWIVIAAAAVALLAVVGSVVALLVRDDGTAEVPAVVGRPEQAAQTMLGDAGFGVKSLRVGVNDPALRGVVQTQDPVAFSTQPKQTVVTINVGYMSVVPNVTGQDEPRAKTELSRAELRAAPRSGVIENEQQPGIVQSQDPAAGTLLQPGTAVTIVVGRDIRVPAVVGLRGRDAEILLARAGFAPVVNTRKVTDLTLDGVVLDQSPGEGAVVPFRSRVDLVVGRVCPLFC